MLDLHHDIIREFYKEGQVASGSEGGSASYQRFPFPVPTLQWVVQHNRGTVIFMEKIRDTNFVPMLASIDVLDGDLFVVNLTEAMTGYVDVIFP